MSEATPNKGITTVPCKECEKTPRYDFFGYCMDCADDNGISDVFPEETRLQNLTALDKRPFSQREKQKNLAKMIRLLQEKHDRGDKIDPILVGRK